MKTNNHPLEVKALTINTAGAKVLSKGNSEKLGRHIQNLDIDFVCCQEVTSIRFEDGTQVDSLEKIRGQAGENNFAAYFAPAIDTDNHPCPRVVPGTNKPGKWYSPLFSGSDMPISYAAQGNGILVSSKWEIIDPFDAKQKGSLTTTAISDLGPFLGDRETEPRIFSVVRVKHKELGIELFIGNTHLTTLRKDNETRLGSSIRTAQVQKILQVCFELPKHIPIILAGDFNAELTSPELSFLEEAGYIAASATCFKKGIDIATHRDKKTFIDHIFYPKDSQILIDNCAVIDPGTNVSDHNPVMVSLSVPLN